MKFKVITKYVLIALVLAVLVCCGSAAADNKFSVDTTGITQPIAYDSTTTLPVKITSTEGFAGFKVYVYNSDPAVSVQINTSLSEEEGLNGMYTFNTEGDPLVVVFAKTTDYSSGTKTAFYVDVTPSSSAKEAVLDLEVVEVKKVSGDVTSSFSAEDCTLSVQIAPSIATAVAITAPVDETKLAYGTEGIATAVVYDQYGDVMEDEPVTWRTEPATGLSIDENGNYKVVNCAEGTVHIFAESGDVLTSNVVKLVKADLESDDFNVTGLGEFVWTGQPFAVTVTAKDGITGIGDITVSYNGVSDAPSDAGSYTVTISVDDGDNYLEATNLELGTLQILPKSLAGAVITAGDALTYTGTEQTQEFTVTLEGKTLTAGTDYTVIGASATNAGDYTVTVTGTGNYADEVTTVWTLNKKSIEGAVIKATDVSYTGEAQTPEFTVTLEGKTLNAGTDYTLNAESGITVGDYTVTITGTSNYAGEATAKWTMSPKSIAKADITATVVTYTGEAQTPEFTVTLGGETLIAGTDYTLNAESGIAVGEYSVTVTGIGNYADEATAKWTMSPKSLAEAEITATVVTYTGEAQTPEFTVTLGGETLIAGTDYALNAESGIAADEYPVTVTGKGNYTGTVSGTWTIGKATLDQDDFTLSANSAEFNGKPQIVTVTPKVDGVIVTATKYNGGNELTEKGKYVITINATGGQNYTDVTNLVVGTFVITGRQVAEPEITGSYTYTGAELTAVIAESADYRVTGNTATAAGTHIVTVSLKDKDNTAWKNGGTDDLKLNWVIAPKSIAGADVTPSTETDAFTYDGTVKVPTFIVTDGALSIAETDYSVEGDSSSAVAGKHQVTIVGQNNYTGEVKAEWKIAPAVPTAANLTHDDIPYVVYGQTYEVTADAAEGVVGLGEITLLYNGTATAPVNAGTYLVNASIAAGTNYTKAEIYLGDLVIAKATPVAANITCVMDDVVYDGKAHALTAKAADGVSGLGAIKLLYNDAEAAPVANATYVVKAQIADGDNYEAATVELGSFNITKAVLTAADFTFTPALPVSYDEGSAEAVVVTVKEGIFGNGDVTVKYGDGDSTDVPTTEGIYKVYATFELGANYTDSEFHLGDMTIVKKVAPVFGDIGTENADGSVTISETQTINEAKNTTTVESNGVSIVIAFSDMTKVNDNEVKGNITGVKAVYPTNDAASPFGDGVSYNLTINLGDKLTPLLPEITPVYNSTIDGKIKDLDPTFTGIAMMTAKGANVDFVNQNLTSVTIVFTIPGTVMDAAGGIDKLVIYHVGDAKPAKMGEKNIKKAVVGDDHIITITGNGFSSYVAGTETSDDTPVSPGIRPSKPSSSSTVIPVTPPAEDEPSDEPSDVPGTEIPDLPQVDPTEPKSPAPVAGMILGALAAAAVLRRK